MKKQLLTALFILCAVCAEAQVIWTVKAGAGISNFYSGPQSVAWKAGLGVDIPLSDKFMFMPAAEIAGKQVLTSYYGYVNGGYNVTDTDYDCILVLGAGIVRGRPSDMLADRLNIAIELYKNGVAPKILVSGDHGQEDYD
ncbi:MAG: YdcF family protein, partial [Prevotella sp.]|nr:YdcF family protein [Prevotella sp.]